MTGLATIAAMRLSATDLARLLGGALEGGAATVVPLAGITTDSRDVTILLIEHDIGVVMNISSHVVVMHQGRKLAEGAPSVVRADPAVKAAYFGNA